MWSFKDCRREAAKKKIGWVRSLFICIPVGLDCRLRTGDFAFNRSFGGWSRRLLGIDGQPPIALILPALVLFWMVYGPTGGWRGLEALVVLGLSLLALLLGARFVVARLMLEFQILAIAVVAAIVWKLGERYSEFNHAMYRHLLIVVFLVLIAIPALLSHLLAVRLFADLRRRHGALFRELLEKVEVFVIPRYPAISWAAIGRSFINAPLRYPLHLLFVPAVVVLFTPFWWREWLPSWAVGSFGVTWLFLSAAALHPRINALLPLSTRALFIGGQLLVSLTIIVLAAGRLFEIGYIATVVESTSVWLVLSYLLAAYTLFWFYEYWTNAVLAEQLVGVLEREGDSAGQATYNLDPGAWRAKVLPDNRAIQVQGGARLIAIGRLEHGHGEAFQAYEKVEIFEHLVEDAPLQPVRGLDREGMRAAVHEIADRVWFYFGVLNVLLVAIAAGGMVGLSKLWQVPELNVEAPAPHASVDLRHLLFDDVDAEHGPRKQAILLAASGGGTRAALYTASVLHGLQTERALSDVVLGSGVSGGGAALAYFAGYRDRLLAANNDAAWRQYQCVMSQPFIQDVLFGVAEWRVMSGTRWGQLLAESFQRRFGFGTYSTAASSRVGLIFNASLAGHLACETCTAATWREYTRKEAWRTKADVAGGRLIITNLAREDAFPARILSEAPEQHLTYAVVTDEVPLTTAAALNANFPPVFANAAVDRYFQDRYWVTDGGAVDNRGIESLLFALRDALERQKGQPKGDAARVLPRIHIIVAEASASTIDYQQDRGVGSALGAAEKFASQLMTELVLQIRALWADLHGSPTDLRFHYLAMPTTLRIRGGIGTHWMMPRFVKLTDPGNPDGRNADYVTVDSAKIRSLIDQLHQSVPVSPLKCDGEDDLLQQLAPLFENRQPQELTKMQDWIEKDPHTARWRALRAALLH